MRMTRRSAVIIAVVCAALAALLTLVFLSSLQKQIKPTEAIEKVRVITPIRDLEPDIPIQANMLVPREVPAEEVPEGAARSIAQLSGKLSLVALPKGEPIRLDQVQSLVGAGLAYVVPDGMRAVTIALDPVPIVGVAGFPKPGDRVDVIATFDLEQLTVTRTILQNVQLLALGETAVIGQKAEAAEAKEGEVKAEPEAQTNATFAVTPDQAQRLVLADARGRLRLALRPKFEEGYVAIKPTSSTDVIGAEYEELAALRAEGPPAQGQPPPETGAGTPLPPDLVRAPSAPTVEVIRGTARETVVVGGSTSSSAQGGAR